MKEQISRTVKTILDGRGDPTALKGAVLDLARVGQVAVSDDTLFGRVAGPMRAEAEAAFGPLTLLLVLTEESRRQVYFAALAGLAGAGRLDEGSLTPEARAEIISALMTLGNEELIRWAFGSCPPGFVRALSRFKDRARSPDLYRRLHALLTEDPELGSTLPALLTVANLDNDLIDMFRALPKTRDGRGMAVLFRSVKAYDRFLSIYRSLTGSAELSAEDTRRLLTMRDHGKFLVSLYQGFPFPDPKIAHPELTYVADLSGLKQVALEFENCLANFLDEAIRGEHQYYVWRPDGEPPVVLRLRADGPFGWYLADLRLKGNKRVPDAHKARLRGLLEGLGVHREDRMEELMRPYVLSAELNEAQEEFAPLEDDEGAGAEEAWDADFDTEIARLFDDCLDGFGSLAA